MLWSKHLVDNILFIVGSVNLLKNLSSSISPILLIQTNVSINSLINFSTIIEIEQRRSSHMGILSLY